jgi:hypothetical protein
MPKSFDQAPELPKMRRRIGRDTTELLVTSLALLVSCGLFGILIRWSVFDIQDNSEYGFIKNFFIALTAILWLLVIRLELTAKKKAENLYEIQMNEYEIMRTKWLEIASKKLEMDAQQAMKPMTIVQAVEQLPVQHKPPEKTKDTN